MDPGRTCVSRSDLPGSTDTLRYQATMDDPATFTRPWTVQLELKRTSQQFEYACHEGNYSMANMLSGSRADEKRAADKAK